MKFADPNVATAAGTTNNWGHVYALFSLKTKKKAAGWTVPRSSDGITYNAGGDQITHSGVGAGGLMNQHAWYVLREPGGRREWCVQVGMSLTLQVRTKYSANAKFSGGTPTAVATPTATDQQVFAGAGTDAAPTYGTVFPNTGNYRYHVLAIDTPVSGAYYFCVFTTLIGTGAQTSGRFFQEPMAPGSFNVDNDADPVAVCCDSGGAGFGNPAGWYGYGTPSQVWAPTLTASVATIFNGSLGTDLVTNTDANAKPWYSATVAAAPRAKGIGAFIGIKGPARTYPATMNTATDAYVYVGPNVVPYADNTVPLL